MLEAIKLHNFQCIATATVDFAPLTLLTGANGAGKSSVIRACLALRQSFLYDGLAAGLQLHGELIRLGSPDDVLHQGALEPGLDVVLKRRNDIRRYIFTRTDTAFVFSRASSLADPFPEPFAWIGTERPRPCAVYPAPTPMQLRYNPPGEAGQFIPHLLWRHGTKPAGPGPVGETAGLAAQTESWLARMGQPVHIRVEECAGSDAVVLEFSPMGGGRPRRAAAMGSGVIRLLPVVAAVLAAAAGSLVFLEHPDAFLSPRAGNALGRFLALNAARGVQLVVETHSEHLINGLSLAVREGLLPPEDMALNLFTLEGTKNEMPGATRIHHPVMDATGRVDEWPGDFFAQEERGSAVLA